MSRQARLFVPGMPSHIIQRGNNRQHCFVERRDYAMYLHSLAKFSHRFDVSVHSFVLMSNHVHMLVTPETVSGVSQLMQSLGRCYVRYFNQQHERTGTLWEGRFKSWLVDSDRYLLTVSRYIEMNPVRAGMVSHPAQYPWSSYHANALGKPIRLLSQHELYLALGQSDSARQRAYRSLFQCPVSMPTLKRIREASNKAWILGDKRFKTQIESRLGRRLPPLQRGGDRRSVRA